MSLLPFAFLLILAIAPRDAKAQGDLAETEWLKIQPVCEVATKGRYPFVRASAEDADLAAFAGLFEPQGKLDAFFTQYLAQNVDQSTSPWSIRQGVGTEDQLSAAALEMFQRAAGIRGAFFGSGADLAVQMDIEPEALEPQAAGVALGIDGTILTYGQGDGLPVPTRFVWPGEIGEAFLALSIADRSGGAERRIDGAWAWPRLIDASSLRPTNLADKRRLVTETEGLIAIFTIRSVVPLPFDLPALDGFICPATLR